MKQHPHFMLISLIFIGMGATFVSGQCRSDQQSLLILLKSQLVYNQTHSSKLVDWTSSTDCCIWSGVTCEQNGLGRVTGLDLSNESISNGLNDSTLFNLTFLETLNLASNNFHTHVPVWLANLTSLLYLNLSGAGFKGQIPIQVAQLTHLVTLDLSGSGVWHDFSLKLEDPNLAMLVQNLTQLRVLCLDGVKISANGTQWSRALSSSLPNLQVLSFSDCSLSGPIDPSLASIKSLSVIQLSNNNFSTSALEFFADFSNLTSLTMSGCDLRGTFPGKIFQVPTLEVLDISYNELLGGSLPEFQKNLSIRNLFLDNTNFSGPLPNSISNLEKLSIVDISACNFLGSVPSSMEYLTELRYLDFSWNMLMGPIPSLRWSKNLNYLDFSYNQLSGMMSSTHWQGLENLSYVDLSHNSISGSIPSSLLALTSLKKLRLSFNEFRGQVPIVSDARFSSLDTLDLSYNELEGPIPSFLFDLRRLQVLLLQSNKLNGTVRFKQIQKLEDLTELDISFNNLTVDCSSGSSVLSSLLKMRILKLASCKLTIFPGINEHTKLLHLDLSGNQITGVVPPWIWKIGNGSLYHLNLSHNLLSGTIDKNQISPSISTLDLHGNNLHGDLPRPPLPSSYLDFSSNRFSSSIPPHIGSLLQLAIFFSLASNGVTGAIPLSICSAIFLQVLDLSNNNLSGKIPDCLFRSFVYLGVLNLSGNVFSGSVPGNIADNCTLRTLDLSKNRLEGFIPGSLANCNRLQILHLGHNHINGTFPCLFKNIPSLRVLVLRSNNFHGPIRCKNEGNWPNLQIFDIAYNNFSGMLQPTLSTAWSAMTVNHNVSYGHLSYSPNWLSDVYYQDSIMVIVKGIEIELVKILTLFTSIDISCNKFEGPIPDTLGQMNQLYSLNMSHNALTGDIPSSFGKLSHLESLDLSMNQLDGSIPLQLTNLTYLSFLNLSYNRLVGSIPRSTQLQSFSSFSFEGNAGLCGPPLLEVCEEVDIQENPPNESRNVIWMYYDVELGFISGFGVAIWSLIFWRPWRILYNYLVNCVLCKPRVVRSMQL